jgi:hypothetical protein
MQKFSASNFLGGEQFCFFSTDLNSAVNCAFYNTHKEFWAKIFFCLLLALFAKFRAKRG